MPMAPGPCGVQQRPKIPTASLGFSIRDWHVPRLGLGLQEAQILRPSVLQAERGSWGPVHQQSKPSFLQGRSICWRKADGQQHLLPSPPHFPEPLELCFCCAVSRCAADPSIVFRPRSAERSETLCYFQGVFQVEIIGSWVSVPRWRTCGRFLQGEGVAPLIAQRGG